MMGARLRSQHGFSLTELAVAIAVIAVIMAGLLSIQMTGQQTYLTGSNSSVWTQAGKHLRPRVKT